MRKKVVPYGLSVVAVLLASYYFYPAKKLGEGTTIDSLVVLKSQRTMDAYSHGRLVKRYAVSLGLNDGNKQREGDKRTPEGRYLINGKNPHSAYHKNLGISYPTSAQVAGARARNEKPGGDIKIHGLRNGMGFIGKFHRTANWTAGCIAVTNEEVDELYKHVPIGTLIFIYP